MTLPNFIIIGAYKSGTTSLHRYLQQHPDIFMSRVKEPNFFSREKQMNLMRRSGREPRVVDNMESYLELFSDVRDEKAIGEASPSYLGDPLAAKRIKETIPDVKLIAILRHPVDAFYSDHNMRIRDRRKLESDFRGRFKDLENRIQSGQTAGPMYHAQLKSYYDIFDSSKIKVYLHEDYMKNNKAVLQDIFKFLEVDEEFFPDTTEMHNVGGIPRFHKLNALLKYLLKKQKIKSIPVLKNVLLNLQRANTFKIPTIPLKLRSEFTGIFREDINNLEKLIGRDLQSWLN